MRTNKIKEEMNIKCDKYKAAMDVIDSLITDAEWYLVDDENSKEEDGKREPDINNPYEKISALRYEAYCVAIEAVRKWAEK
jgi:hypothetical protein